VPTLEPKYVTTDDGRRITYDRWRYEEGVKQEAVIKNVNTLIASQASNAVSVGAQFGQQEYGGLLRSVIPTLLDQFGMVNAQAAVDYYNQTSIEWLKANGEAARQQAGRGNVNLQASRYAAARTQGALAVAQGYSAQFADTYDVVAKTDAVVNFAMKVRATQGHGPSVEAMSNALTREVAMYHRDTILFNSALDKNVAGVQRVAQAGACDFCKLMALGSTRGKVRVSSYAARFHANCHCTIQPLFKGEAPIRPDYYNTFEAEYEQASAQGGSAKDILAKWNKNQATE
jgi:hypothetical protein